MTLFPLASQFNLSNRYWIRLIDSSGFAYSSRYRSTAGASIIMASPLLLLIVIGLAHQVHCAGREPHDWTVAGINWGERCSEGSAQSPVDLSTEYCDTTEPSEWMTNMINELPNGILGQAKGVEAVFDAGDLELTWKEWDNDAALESIVSKYGEQAAEEYYNLVGKPLNLHFHTTSEHTVNGRLYIMEGHIVRQLNDTACDAAPCYAVFGILFKLPADPYAHKNGTLPILQEILSLAPEAVGPKEFKARSVDAEWVLDFAQLFPENLEYFAYNGSLTTPPCSEGIKWTVFRQPQPISVPDLSALEKLTANAIDQPTNNRIVQPLGSRTLYCPNMAVTEDPTGEFFG